MCAKEKPHVRWLDGWMGIGMRVMDNKGEIRETMDSLHLCLLSLSHTDAEKKAGRGKSPESIHHIAP